MPARRKPTGPVLRSQSAAILKRLRREYPSAITALHHGNPFQLLIATILSAQCTDERVNSVTPNLFSRFPGPGDLAEADQAELEEIIRSTGFFRMKARNILGCSRAIMERHEGEVPRSLDELVRLPGVGRKTANVVLGQAFGIAVGIVVDTHVHRLAKRMGFTRSESAEGAERDLMGLFPPKDWIFLGSALILHGRNTCGARKPACSGCIVEDLCPSAGTFGRT